MYGEVESWVFTWCLFLKCHSVSEYAGEVFLIVFYSFLRGRELLESNMESWTN